MCEHFKFPGLLLRSFCIHCNLLMKCTCYPCALHIYLCTWGVLVKIILSWSLCLPLQPQPVSFQTPHVQATWKFSFQQGRGDASLADKLVWKCDVLNPGYSDYNTRWAKIILPRLIRKGTILDNPAAVKIFFGANDDALKSRVKMRIPSSTPHWMANLKSMVQYLKPSYFWEQDPAHHAAPSLWGSLRKGVPHARMQVKSPGLGCWWIHEHLIICSPRLWEWRAWSVGPDAGGDQDFSFCQIDYIYHQRKMSFCSHISGHW